ncbi:MAG TPA: O-antigen ligase domain-containing protein, partial [Crenalkalicoccus sp.]|nr:O-antigen ligase domain-containing protein [Crenalkalicoccus sp.]
MTQPARPVAAPLAVAAGPLAAILHFAGALKSLPGLAGLPFDLTAAAAALLLPSLLLLALLRKWRFGTGLALPLAGCAALLPWLVVAGAWSASAGVLAEKLPQAALLGPAMLAAGLLVGADPPTLRRFCGTTLLIGLAVGIGVAWGVATDSVLLGGEVGADPARIRVQYQIAGLAIAGAAA